MKITNEDNMQLMARYEDNHFDLAITDPPYEIPKSWGGAGKLKNRIIQKQTKKLKIWDKAPSKEYFNELFRISKNQIIWGGNYFDLPPTRGIICWDKKQPFPNFSAWEMAWTSFDKPAKIFRYDNRRGGKIHPTQKPVKLYEWLLIKYAKEGDKILDTHLGSGSLAIACHNLGYHLTACELDKEYYNAAIKRLEKHTAQLRIY